jgi:hypothetical protein
MNNGTTSEYLSLKRGVRQGDPLSPYLFILVTEILTVSIRQNGKIKGINIGNDETKILQYADDTNVTFNDVNSLKHFLKTEEYGEVS